MFTVNRLTGLSINRTETVNMATSKKRNKIDSNSLDITDEIVIPPMKQSVNYITQLILKHKLQDNNEIKNSGQVKQKEHKNTHYALHLQTALLPFSQAKYPNSVSLTSHPATSSPQLTLSSCHSP